MKLQLIAVKMSGKIVESFKLADITNPIRNQFGLVDKSVVLNTKWVDSTIVADILGKNKAEIIGIEADGFMLVGSNGAFTRYGNLINPEQGKKYPLTVFERVNIGGVDGCTVIDVDGRVLTVSMDKLVAYAEKIGISNGKVVTQGQTKFISSIKGEYNRVGAITPYEKAAAAPIEEVDDVKLMQRIRYVKQPGMWPEGAHLIDENLHLTVEEKIIIAYKTVQNWNFFIYSILASLKLCSLRPSYCPTMGVGVDMTLVYNPKYIRDIPLNVLVFTVIHEAYHMLFSHPARIEEHKQRMKKLGIKSGFSLKNEMYLYNIAADLYVNKFIAEQFNETQRNMLKYPHTVIQRDPFVTNKQPANWTRGVKDVLMLADCCADDTVDTTRDTLESLYADLLEQKRREREERRRQQEQEKQQQQSEDADDSESGQSGGSDENSQKQQATDNDSLDSSENEAGGTSHGGQSSNSEDDADNEASRENSGRDTGSDNEKQSDGQNQGDKQQGKQQNTSGETGEQSKDDIDPEDEEYNDGFNPNDDSDLNNNPSNGNNDSSDYDEQGDSSDDLGDEESDNGQGSESHNSENNSGSDDFDENNEDLGHSKNNGESTDQYGDEEQIDDMKGLEKGKGGRGGEGKSASSQDSDSDDGDDSYNFNSDNTDFDDDEQSEEAENERLDKLGKRNMDERRQNIASRLDEFMKSQEETGDLISNDDAESELSPEERQELEMARREALKNWKDNLKNTVMKAEVASSSRGFSLSAAERRLVDEIIKSRPLNWKQILKKMFNMATTKKASFKRPSRRPEIGHNVVLPGKVRKEPEGLEKIIVGIDTSGSVSDSALLYILGYIKNLAENFRVDIDIVWWSSVVNGTEKIKSVPDLVRAYRNVASDGGTCVDNFFRHVKDPRGPYHGKKVHGIIIITDGYVGRIDKKYATLANQTVWLIHSRGKNNFEAPFGTIRYIDVED